MRWSSSICVSPAPRKPIPPFLAIEVGPAAHQPRCGVAQLRELHLQLAFVRPRTRAEDVQDQFGPCHHAAFQVGLDVALLRRRQVVIEHDEIGRMRRQERTQFLQFAGADEQARIGTLAARSQQSRVAGCRQSAPIPRTRRSPPALRAGKTERGRALRAAPFRVFQTTISLSLSLAMPPRAWKPRYGTVRCFDLRTGPKARARQVYYRSDASGRHSVRVRLLAHLRLLRSMNSADGCCAPAPPSRRRVCTPSDSRSCAAE